MVGRRHFGECSADGTTLLSSFQDEVSIIEPTPVVSLTLNHRLMALVLPGHNTNCTESVGLARIVRVSFKMR